MTLILQIHCDGCGATIPAQSWDAGPSGRPQAHILRARLKREHAWRNDGARDYCPGCDRERRRAGKIAREAQTR